jgi:hypothetical protein
MGIIALWCCGLDMKCFLKRNMCWKVLSPASGFNGWERNDWNLKGSDLINGLSFWWIHYWEMVESRSLDLVEGSRSLGAYLERCTLSPAPSCLLSASWPQKSKQFSFTMLFNHDSAPSLKPKAVDSADIELEFLKLSQKSVLCLLNCVCQVFLTLTKCLTNNVF